MINKDIIAAVILIGNEILSGRTTDANLPYIAKKLGQCGIKLIEVRVIPDIEEVIITTIHEMQAKADHIFTTGGIGPTHDDITSESIAKALGLVHEINAEAERRLSEYYHSNNLEINEARKRMMRMPRGAVLIDNPISIAPGFSIQNIHVMAGVPKIMQAMLDLLLPTLEQGQPILMHTIFCNLFEGQVAEGLGQIQNQYPKVDIGSYPSFQYLNKPNSSQQILDEKPHSLALCVKGQDSTMIEKSIEAIRQMIINKSGQIINEEKL